MGVQLAKEAVREREKQKTKVNRVLRTLFSPYSSDVLLREVLVQKEKPWVRQTLDFLLEHIKSKGLESRWCGSQG